MDSDLFAASLRALERVPCGHVHAAWIGGSLVEGLGNPSSDVDIFVAVSSEISEHTVTRLAEDHGVLAFVSDGLRFDIELWPIPAISRLLARVNSVPIDDPEKNNLHFLEYWESEFIHRLLTGVPLREPHNFSELRSQINKTRFQRYLLDTAVRRVDDAFDDAVGMLRSGQSRMASIRALDALEFGVDCYLYAHGFTNDKAKFRIRKLELAVASDPLAANILERFWNCRSCIPQEEQVQEEYVRDVLRYTSELVNNAQAKFRMDQA